MKKKYTKLDMEVIAFDSEDVITGSGVYQDYANDGDDGEISNGG